MVPRDKFIVVQKEMRASIVHVTTPPAANLRPRHQTPLSTAPPMSVHAHASHTGPQTGRYLAHQASAPCPPARSPKTHVSSQPNPKQVGHASACPGIYVMLTFSASRVRLPCRFTRSTSHSASLVNAIFNSSIFVLPFTNGSSAAVQAAASLSLVLAFAASTTSAAFWGDLRLDGGSRIRGVDLCEFGMTTIPAPFWERPLAASPLAAAAGRYKPRCHS